MYVNFKLRMNIFSIRNPKFEIRNCNNPQSEIRNPQL